MLSLDTVAAAAARIEWEGAVRRGVRALSEITGAGEEREDGGGERKERVEKTMLVWNTGEKQRREEREGEREKRREEQGREYGRDSDINRNEKEEEKKER